MKGGSVIAVWLLAGCPEPTTDDDDGGDAADADTDTDSDTDSDTDADTDSETDTDDTDPADTDDCTPNAVFPADDGAADVVLDGSINDLAGQSVAVADVDGDGFDDLLVGGSESDFVGGPLLGRVWLAYGPLTATGTLDTLADAIFEGVVNNARLGREVGSLGDIDGDGLNDVAMIADNQTPTGEGDDGVVYVEYGATTRNTGLAGADATDSTILGVNTENEYFTSGVTGVGDWDHDGDDEVVFADDHAGGFPYEGRVYLLPGSAVRLVAEPDLSNMPTIAGAEASDSLCAGQCLAADDFDGDGEIDLAISSDRNDITGRVYLRYGDGSLPVAEIVSDYPALEQSPVTSNFGTEMVAAGDLDGDGIADLVVSDHGNGQAAVDGGRVWVVRGSSTRWVGASSLAASSWLTIEGVQESGEIGSALLGLGDVDCDGSDDLAVSGVFLDGTQDAAGVVGIWLGVEGGIDRLSDATARLLGGVGQQQFGSSLAHGDLDGDGEGDLVVGAEGYGTYSGRVYVFSGAF